MYCVKCGVELQKGIEKCPLCGTRVYHPDIIEEKEPGLYPEYREPEHLSSHGLLLVTSILALIPIIVCPLIDLRVNGYMLWSGYVIGGVVTAYLWLLLPYWFRRRSPTVFFPIGTLSAGVLLLYINVHTHGHWFLSFALPVLAGFLAISETVIVLMRHVSKQRRHRKIVIFGGGFIAAGALCVLIEVLLHVTFGLKLTGWSLIPFTVLLIMGILMVVIAANKKLREAFYKKFFI